MMTPRQFIERIAPIAVKLRLEGSPLFPSVRIAQAALETGWTIPPWNNVVGYKVGSGKTTPYWDGRRVNKDTWEVIDGEKRNVAADFRAYPSIEHCFRDQDLLFQLPRYQEVRLAQSPEEQAHALLRAGYATDPAYAGKIIAIINSHQLKMFDREVEQVIAQVQKLQEQVQQLQQQVKALNELQRMPAVPEWAKDAVAAAQAAGLIDTPEKGSYDFYRLLTVLHRRGLLAK